LGNPRWGYAWGAHNMGIIYNFWKGNNPKIIVEKYLKKFAGIKQ